MASRKAFLSRNLEDVDVSGVDDNDSLVWDSGESKWKPVAISGGGGGVVDFPDLGDVPSSYATFSGYFVRVNDDEDALIFDTVAAGGGHIIQYEGMVQTQRTNLNFEGNAVTVLDDSVNDATKIIVDLASGILSQEVYETLTAQVVSGISHFSLSDEIADGSLRVYYNGIRQQGDYFVVDSDNLGFTTDFVVEVGDEIFVDYEITTSGIGLLTAYFTSLLDTPANYTAASGLYVKVTDVEDGLEFSAVSGGGGVSILSDTQANEPAAGTEEDLFMPTDGIYIKRDTGSIWQPWGLLMPMVEPILGDFMWVNQGTATVDDTHGGMFMTALAAAGDSHKILKMDAPATPYSLIVGLIPQMFDYNYQQCGIGFRQSSDGKMVSITTSAPAPELVVNKWNSPTSYNATYVGYNVNIQYAPMVWLKIEDDGVDRISYWSLNGVYWTEIHSVGRTDFITADEIYVYVSSSNATYPASVLVLSWLLE